MVGTKYGTPGRRRRNPRVDFEALGAAPTEGAAVVVVLQDRALLMPRQLFPHIQLLHEVLERLEGNRGQPLPCVRNPELHAPALNSFPMGREHADRALLVDHALDTRLALQGDFGRYPLGEQALANGLHILLKAIPVPGLKGVWDTLKGAG